ncbi:13E12 repeat family protein [Kribbella sp. NBC_01245]|uniref:DUF222 domain-containing protein n=1 Tax=Kribbella sp. NBC_01245 TaxID=2903578 RepID=UPI002E2AD5EF|nr:DUF222 domain-containing protein [Kribbella sp. NBC_01245]
MFDNGVDELDVDQTLDRAAASRARIAADEAESLLLALHYTDLNATVEPPPGGEIVPGVERLRVYGGEGCPPIAEFCAQEFGWRLGMSHGAAAAYLGEALALRHRFPKILAQVLAGNAEAWRARSIARTCLSLSLAAAGIVDAKIHAIINTVTPSRLKVFVKAAKMQADPAKAQADADLYARQRGVWLGQSNDHGTKSVIARTATGDAIRFDAAVDELAEIMAQEGEPGSHQQLRAKAVGLLADPAVALDLREHGRRKARKNAAQTTEGFAEHCTSGSGSDSDHEYSDGEHGNGQGGNSEYECGQGDIGGDSARTADTRGPQQAPGGHTADGGSGSGSGSGSHEYSDGDGDGDVPVDRLVAGFKARNRSRGLGRAPHTFYVHISQESLASGQGIVRVEGIGPMLVSDLKELIAGDAVTLKPVIDLREQLSAGSYEIPQRIREWVKLRYPTPMEPWSTGETTFSTDLDHVVPYDKNGPPGQTSTRNLLPVTRTPHRAKTHGGLRNALLPDGSVEWTTPRGARYLVVDHTGTHYLGQVNLTTGELTPPPRQKRGKSAGKTKRKTGKRIGKDQPSRIDFTTKETPKDCN